MNDHLKFLGREAALGRLSRREFMGRAAALGLTVSAAGTLLSTSVRAQAPRKGGHLKLGLEGGAATDVLDPAKCTSQVCFVTGRNWGDTLVESHPETGLPVPALAESWEASEDAKTWTFTIRSGVQFHNGKEMTIDDVVATLKRHSDENSESGALGVMKTISEIKAEDGKLVVSLADGNADLPLLLSDYHLIIQPGGGVDDPNAGIGTGPYKVASAEPGVRLTFEKFADYWNPERGHVDSIEIVVINDATARTAALSSGQVHFINRVDPKTVDLLKRAPTVKIENTSGRGHYVFIMHCNTAPFDNNDLRLALKYAMDREKMVETILRGYGKVGNDYPINETYALAPTGIEQRAYDPDKAKFHFKKSGHEGSVLLRTSSVAFPGAVDAAVLYQASAKDAGIDIEIQREPGDGYWSNVWNVQPFSTSYWGGRPTQDYVHDIGNDMSNGFIATRVWLAE